MAIKNNDWRAEDKTSSEILEQERGNFTIPIIEDETLGVQVLNDKVNEVIDLVNLHITKIETNKTNADIGAKVNAGIFKEIVSADGREKFDISLFVTTDARSGLPVELNFQVTTSNGKKFNAKLPLVV